jgi:hypothetical protein
VSWCCAKAKVADKLQVKELITTALAIWKNHRLSLKGPVAVTGMPNMAFHG